MAGQAATAIPPIEEFGFENNFSQRGARRIAGESAAAYSGNLSSAPASHSPADLNSVVAGSHGSQVVGQATGDSFPLLSLSDGEAAHSSSSSSGEPWWKTALSVAGDIGIGVGAAALAPETGGASMLAVSALEGAGISVAENLKSQALFGHADWSPTAMVKNTATDGAIFGVGRYVLPRAIGAFSADTASTAVDQIGTELAANPATSNLSGESLSTIENRLSPQLTKSAVAGTMTQSQIDAVLGGVVSKDSPEFAKAAQIIQDFTPDHVVTANEFDSAAEALKGQARVKATEIALNSASSLATKAALYPITGHLDGHDVIGSTVNGGTVRPAASLAATAFESLGSEE